MKYLIMCEGPNELEIIRMLLEHDKLIFTEGDLLNLVPYHARQINNNRFCLHKHAWKLIDTICGVRSSMLIYSITETAKANRLTPFHYLEFLLEELKEHQDDAERSFIDALLPRSARLPEICWVK